MADISENDWMDYLVNLPYSCTYTVNFRVATNRGSVKFQIRKEDGTIITTISVPNTGGLHKWQTVSVSVNLKNGEQTLRIFATRVSGSLNINWLEIILGINNSSQNRISQPLLSANNPVSSTSLYPSHVIDKISVEIYNGYKGKMIFQIVNRSGKILKQIRFSKESQKMHTVFLIGDLPKGEYLIVLQTKNTTETKKIIKL